MEITTPEYHENKTVTLSINHLFLAADLDEEQNLDVHFNTPYGYDQGKARGQILGMIITFVLQYSRRYGVPLDEIYRYIDEFDQQYPPEPTVAD